MTERGEISFESRQAMFMQEASEIESKYGRQALDHYFQNLWITFSEEYRDSELMDKKPMEATQQTTGQTGATLEHFSKLRTGQTYREFYSHLDEVAEKLGILERLKQEAKTISQMGRNLGSPGDAEFPGRIKSLQEYRLRVVDDLKPLYAFLRAEGYSDYDITGNTRKQFLEEHKPIDHGTTH